MSLRSVDLQIMLPRVGELSNVQQKQLQQGQLDQQSISSQIQKSVINQQQTVQKKIDLEHPNIKKDSEDKSKKNKEFKKLKKNRDDDEGFDENSHLGTNIDIKI